MNIASQREQPREISQSEPAEEEILRRRRSTYFVDRLIAALSIRSATAFGCET
jgi:hypothetical protein